MLTCSVKKCDKSAHAHGLCRSHYDRVRLNGKTKRLRTANGEPLSFILNVALPFTDNEACLIWPYSTSSSGYGTIRLKSGMKIVSRIVCRKVNGKPPTKRHKACHSCGKGKLACINPNHLYWGTDAENEADKIDHGTQSVGQRNGQAKMTDAKVLVALRLINKGTPNRVIADKFDVDIVTIRRIRNGTSWTHIAR